MRVGSEGVIGVGTEFFNRNKGAIRQCREKQKIKLASELSPEVEETSVLNFKTWTGRDYGKDQKFEISIENEKLTAFVERSPVGFVDCKETKLIQRIRASGGRAIGTLDRNLKRSGQLCLKITVPDIGETNEHVRQQGVSI